MGTNDKNTTLSDAELDALFTQAREVDADVSEALMARIMSDAAENVPAPVTVAPRPSPRGRGWFSGLFELMGGAPAAAGLVLAAMTGVGFGYLDEAVLDSTASVLGFESGQYDVGDLYVSFPSAE